MSLIERLEAASGPDRELDMLVMAAVTPGSRVVYGKGRRWYSKPGAGRTPFHVSGGKGVQWGWMHQRKQPTRLIDDAMTLVPEGWVTTLTIYHDCSTVVLADDRVTPVRLPDIEVDANAPALALCIASLKARGIQ